MIQKPICQLLSDDEMALVGKYYDYDTNEEYNIITSNIVKLEFYADNFLEVHTKNSRYGCRADEFLDSLFGQFNVLADTKELFTKED